ncbi:MAG: NADH-quinone oxidoreductase subunit H [Bacteroidetes bacterium]|nr:MAG: NADH-quinone oxidoreductase subunit H [Bacteroidota bacterium]
MDNSIWISILGFLATVALAFVVGVLYGGLVRKVTARIQNRVGPPFYQNFFDIVKLYSKTTAINHGWMQHLGPALAITASVTSLMFIPILNGQGDMMWFENLNFKGDLIFLLYMMVFGSLGMALGAGQTGNPHSAIGVSRGLSQMVGYEIPWVLALVAIMMQAETTSITGLIDYQNANDTWMMFESPLAFIAGILAMLGMFHYAPFDVPFAPAELASGPASEFGGKYLALMMTSGSIMAFVKLVLFVDIFMGGASNLVMLLVKTFLLYMVPVLYGIVSPRYRTEQSIRYFWGWPTAIGVLGVLYVVFIR